MTIAFRCGQCGQLLRVPDQSAGKNARCPKCNALMQVPPAPMPAPGGYAPAPGNYVPLPGAMPQAPGFPGQQPGPVYPGQPVPQQPANPYGQFAGMPPADPYGQPTGLAMGYGNPPAGPAPSLAPDSPGSIAISTRGSATRAKSASAGVKAHAGLPWEAKRQNLGTWWQTAMLVMMESDRAFRMMRQTGGLGTPIMFAIWGQGIGYVAQSLWIVPIMIYAASVRPDKTDDYVLEIALRLFGGAVGVVLSATIGNMIIAGIFHLCLSLVGGALKPYETTFRVLAYVQGSLALLNIIPVCGPLVGAIWAMIAMIIGLAAGHGCSVGKSAGAFFIALFLMIGLCIGIYVLLIGVILAIVATALGAR